MNIHISLAAQQVFQVFGFSLTNSMVASMLASGVVFVLMLIISRFMSVQPNYSIPFAIESASDIFMDMMTGITQSREKALRFFPFLATLFLFIICNNWLGLLPGFGSLTVTAGHGTVPLLRGATADLNTTLALAIISVVLSHVYAIRELGFKLHLKKYVSWNPILLFVGMLELVSDFSKVMSFSFRLFGNIFAGEVLLVVIAYLMPLLAPLPFFLLELFVGFVQALVFTMLSLVFLTIATSHHGEHEEAVVVGNSEVKQVV